MAKISCYQMKAIIKRNQIKLQVKRLQELRALPGQETLPSGFHVEKLDNHIKILQEQVDELTTWIDSWGK